MKFAVCNELFEPWPLDQAFEFAASCGYAGVEIAPFTLGGSVSEITAARRGEIRDAAQRSGLEVVGLHWLLAKTEGFHVTSPEADVRRRTTDYLASLARLCADLGGKIMVFGSPSQRSVLPGVTHEQANEHAVEVLRNLTPVLEATDVTLALEPLGPEETNFMNTADEAEDLIARIASPRVRLHLDCKSMATEKRPAAELVETHAANLAHFHANDPNRQGPGFGSLDLGPILTSLRKIDYQGWVSVEAFDYAPGVERTAKESIRYLERRLAEAISLLL